MDSFLLDNEIKQYILDNPGVGRTNIMQAFPGTTEWRIRNILKDIREGRRGQGLPFNSSHLQVVSKLQPVVINLPPLKEKSTTKSDLLTAVFVGDTHGVFVDHSALDVACQVIQDVNPDILVHLGDLVDFYSVSRFSKDPTRRLLLQDEVNQGASILGQLTQAAPKARKLLMQGNHTARLEKYIQNNAPSLAGLKELQIENLLGLDQLGWEFVKYDMELVPEFIIKHGDLIRAKGGATARAEMEQNWTSGISGHTHRLSVYEFTPRRNYLKGLPPALWVENGSLCMQEMDYFQGNHNWQQGFSIVRFTKDNQPLPELIHIFRGTTYYNGKTYKS